MSDKVKVRTVDDYINGVEPFARLIFQYLRALIHSACPNIEEELKWGIPHFQYKGEAVCIFAAYQKHCSFSFWKSSLMSDTRLKTGSDLPAAERFMGKLTRIEDLPPEADLAQWIEEAASLNERGVKLPTRKASDPKEVTTPPAFAERLKADPQIEAIFMSKSPSFQKEYNLWIGEAKTQATRDKRIEEALLWIAEGKGRFWKYAK